MVKIRKNDPLTPEQRHKCMSSVRSKDTRPERIIRSKLHNKGLRFRKHRTDLPGKPDAAFIKEKIAIFIDGDFWHGYNFKEWKNELPDFWKNKITKNIERDIKNRKELIQMGWRVLQLWEHDVESKPDKIVDDIYQCIKHGDTTKIFEYQINL